jgi:predicted RNA-binding Zn ribbon-like protein
MSPVPAWYPNPEEGKPAPPPLLLVQGFLNTEDVESDTDLLEDVTVARDWFVEAGLLAASSRLRSAEVTFARRLRESLRALLASDDHGPPSEAQLEPIRELVRTRHPRLDLDERGVLVLGNPEHGRLADGLFELLLIVRAAQEDGSWARLKACTNEECGWVFYDRSRNRQGSWCDMAVCGNRLKNRRLRARRR